ncbi:MAG: hypothetical protein F4Y22_05100 [Gammaproteobacteria bacterium]|nr:hypothetical protein [Gammaproteobacteria bacterium]MYH46130.1 hypothetical protein [Gammaproteobacteria bacterium]MYL14696.1 hypothetical protein [Gammaproteobacteria bacterium]
MSLQDCAKAIQLDGVGHIGRFLTILNLPEDLRHLVGWGADKSFLGFTAAFELTKLNDDKEQRIVAEAIMSDGLTSKEVRQIAQLRNRSEKTIRECLNEVLGMRKQVTKRFVFVGSMSTESESILAQKTQSARDSILTSAIVNLGIRSATGRLGPKLFTLVGNEDFNASMLEIGKENIEARIRALVAKALENGSSES